MCVCACVHCKLYIYVDIGKYMQYMQVKLTGGCGGSNGSDGLYCCRCNSLQPINHSINQSINRSITRSITYHHRRHHSPISTLYTMIYRTFNDLFIHVYSFDCFKKKCKIPCFILLPSIYILLQ